MSEQPTDSKTTKDMNPVSSTTAKTPPSGSSEPIGAATVETPPTIDLTDDSGSGESKNATGS